MRYILSVFVSTFLAASSVAQRIHLGLFGGVSAYNGDLTEKTIQKKSLYAAIGITGNYEIADQFMFRTGLTYARVGAADRFNKSPDLVQRNLSFQTTIVEFSVVGEYYLLNLYNRVYSPYFFAGLALYHFNPYAYDVNNQKVFLRPLSTEGEGITGYPDRRPYSLIQMAIPYGAGIKFAVNDNLRIGVEAGLRKLFTDYLDDVSKSYIDSTDLLQARGQLAVDMSYRGDELPGGSPSYPAKASQRGSDKRKDYYYFAGIHLSYRLGGEKSVRLFSSQTGKGRIGCPIKVY